MKILIADDDTTTRDILGAMINTRGYELVAVEDGDQAWEIMRQPEAPRLAVLDWVMPGLDGVDVCRRLRALGSPRAPYIIMLTRNKDKARVIEGLMSGVDDYLIKPCLPEELFARVEIGCRVIAARDKARTEVPRHGEDMVEGLLEKMIDMFVSFETAIEYLSSGDSARNDASAEATLKTDLDITPVATLKENDAKAEKTDEIGELELLRELKPKLDARFAHLREEMDKFLAREKHRRLRPSYENPR